MGYGKVGLMRKLDVILYDENNNALFDGKTIIIEELPDEIKEKEYRRIEVGNPTKIYL